MSTDLRAQSGIDRILREEGLEKEIRELRALRESLSKQAMLDSLVDAVNRPPAAKPKPASKVVATAKKDPAAATTGDAEPEKKNEPAAATADVARDAGASNAGSAEGVPASIAKDDDANAEPAPLAHAAPAISASAAALIKKPEGTPIARGEPEPRTDVAPAAPEPTTVRPEPTNPYDSFREREYPSYGPDHYEAMPDDFDDSEDFSDDGLPPLEERAS
jgi:sec-independent protein translocase protein TatB